MPTQEISFKKGFNPAVDSFSCPSGHCLTMNDFILNYGNIMVRPGNIAINTAFSGSPAVVGMFLWADTTGVMYLYVTTNDGNIWRSTSQFSLSYPIAFTNISNSLTVNLSPVTWDVLNGILVNAGNSGTVYKITGHAVNQVALVVPSAYSICKTANNFMFLSGGFFTGTTPATWSRVAWSNVGDPTTYTAANFIDFRLNDGDYISALAELSGNLLVFKTQSTGLLSTTTSTASGVATLGPMTTIFKNIGCLGPNCFDNLPDGTIVFLGGDLHLYQTDGASVQDLSTHAPPDWMFRDYIVDNSKGIPAAALTYIRYYPFRNEIIVSLNYQSGNTKLLAFDMSQKYWRVINGMIPNSILTRFAAIGNQIPPNIFYVGGNTGYIFDMEGGFRSGTAPYGDNFWLIDDTKTNLPSIDISTATQFPLNEINSDQVTLSIIYSTNVTVTGSVNLNFAFDGGSYTSTTLTLPATTQGRLDTKIPVVMNSRGQRPTSLSIKFSITSSTMSRPIIYKVFISDEVNA